MINELIKKYEDKELCVMPKMTDSELKIFELFKEEILQDLKELKEKCLHSKKYDNLVRCSNPPKRQWICQICGEVGYDVIGKE